MDAPVFGADATPFPEAGSWEASLSWRYQKSFRHFVGSEEQHERFEDGSQVINRIHLADVTVRYNASPRTSFAVSVPYLMATRSNPIRNTAGEVIDRSVTQARGMGDLIVSGRRWLLDPEKSPRFNFQVGLGLKLPTGANNVVDTARTFSNGTIVSSVRTVDQSIQPGDGGFGLLVDAAGFLRFASDKASA